MYEHDFYADLQTSSHPEKEQQTTKVFPQHVTQLSDSGASVEVAEPGEVQSPPSGGSSLAVPKLFSVEPTDVGSASTTLPNFRIRSQETRPAEPVESRAEVRTDRVQTYSQEQGGASLYPTYAPVGAVAGRGSLPMEMARNDYNYQNPPESGSGVLDKLMDFVSGRLFNKKTSDHDKEKYQKLASELRKKLQQLEQSKSKMASAHQQEVSRLNQVIQWHRGEEAKLQQQVHTLEEHKAQLHDRCNKFDENLRVIQEKSLRHVSSGRWLAQDDLNTYATLRSLRDQIKSWAVKFSIKNPQELDYLCGEDRQEDLAELKSYLGSIFDGTEATLAPTDISATKVTSMMLTAVLAHDMHNKVVGNPFFFLDGGVVQNSQPPSSVFLNVYNLMIRVNVTEAHKWRCQMIRALSEQPRGMDNKTAPQSKFLSQKQAACAQLMDNFLFGPARFLLRDIHDPEEVKVRGQEMFNIWMLAGNLSTDLWTQLPYTQCHYLQELQSAKFHFNSPRVEAHRLYKLEDGDPRLNERDIAMVIYPAVLASGNVDGEGYDEERVLVKATVWLSREWKQLTSATVEGLQS
ncbi:hypothetical protein N431DRAFT_485842 [Stipitochalara longipes BDJ]|nr:hypothetical protein N431DRAFT_485842 [Stipitochalara longipes BDJ]